MSKQEFRGQKDRVESSCGGMGSITEIKGGGGGGVLPGVACFHARIAVPRSSGSD